MTQSLRSYEAEPHQQALSGSIRADLWPRNRLERKQTRSRHKSPIQANKTNAFSNMPVIDALDCQEFASTRRFAATALPIARRNEASSTRTRTKCKSSGRRRFNFEKEDVRRDNNLAEKSELYEPVPVARRLIDVLRTQETLPNLQPVHAIPTSADSDNNDTLAGICHWPATTTTCRESYQVKDWYTSKTAECNLTSRPAAHVKISSRGDCLQIAKADAIETTVRDDCSIVDCRRLVDSFGVDCLCYAASQQLMRCQYGKVPTSDEDVKKEVKRCFHCSRDGGHLASRSSPPQSSLSAVLSTASNHHLLQQQQQLQERHFLSFDRRKLQTIVQSHNHIHLPPHLVALTLVDHQCPTSANFSGRIPLPPPPQPSSVREVESIKQSNFSHKLTHCQYHRTAPKASRATAIVIKLPLLLLLAAILISVGQMLLPATRTLPQIGQAAAALAAGQQADPRPTIYSGQVSFGLLLSAHMSPATESSVAAASNRHETFVASTAASGDLHKTTLRQRRATDGSGGDEGDEKLLLAATGPPPQLARQSPLDLKAEASHAKQETDGDSDENDDDDEGRDADERIDESPSTIANQKLHKLRNHERRQIFERPSQYQVRRQQQQQQQQLQQKSLATSTTKQQHATSSASIDSGCGDVNPNALYAGMGAIWASHQANLVGDSQLAIGTYVYDSCNDLDVGQRQSVRIVSNLNAFQQTTCESPRGSPISLTIAHGDNQLRAIQLLTSFRVPVVTTKEPFALEDYHLLSREQRRFLFSTAPSSRHLAVGALKFTKRIVSRSTSSAKLPNQFHKMSSKNGLIVISRNLPAKFIAYLTETIPNHVNYEMLQSNQPIDQVRSAETLESILINYHRSGSSASSQSSQASGSLSESRPLPVVSDASARDGYIVMSDEILASKLAAPSRSASSTSNSNSNNSKRDKLRRGRRYTGSDDSDSGTGSIDSDSSDDQQQQHRMLSPTILMFITPSEAIDLITRLRNDLAEVSRYYSLIVTTREDISPALRTIFHRGGSRLCSGKAFYTISPKPDEVNEFSRYFRDTVQMEGESSDHPLVCEFAKHQATSKRNADLDDVSTEAVIKAVWSAAAAFKLVHKRECGHLLAAGGSGANLYAAAQAGGSGDSGDNHSQHQRSSSNKQGRQSSAGGPGGTATNKSVHAECMVKMNKNMSSLVQRALKKLDVYINSTGLQALDGFRIKFDEMNELLTNKYSIKYINKECEITEIGQYSGWKDSQLQLDDDLLIKSLESTLPDPWPLSSGSPSASSAGTTLLSGISGSDSTSSPSSSSSSSSGSSLSSGGGGEDSPSTNGDPSSQADSSSSSGNGDDGPSTSSSSKPTSATGEEDQDSTTGSGGLDGDKLPSITLDSESPKRKRSNSKLNVGKQQQQFAMSSSSRGLMASDFGQQASPNAALSTAKPLTTTRQTTTNGPSLHGRDKLFEQTTGTTVKSAKSMRKMKPFPSGGVGVTLKDWLPRDETTTMAATSASVSTTTTRIPRKSTVRDEASGGTEADGRADVATAPLKEADGQLESAQSTTRAPIYATLPESGGNTDLDMPAFKSATTTTSSRPSVAKSSPTAASSSSSTTTSQTVNDTRHASTNSGTRGRNNLETAATSDSSDYVTLPSIVRHSTQEPNLRVSLQQEASTQTVDADLLHNSSNSKHQHRSLGMDFLENQQSKLDYLRDLNVSPVPLVPGQSLLGADDTIRPLLDQLNQSARGEQHSSSRSRFSWFTIAILGANICGALLTLYVLTFLLMKNCDGSLDRENQGIRSIHLLSIIVVFFGSTLFIVYPTPGLCLLRTSWHNFSLVLIFGTLLLQSMQTRSIGSIGLGGRPNRLNQFLTLVFMVGVQVSFELQRWKYESANYVNFVNQYFGSTENGDSKLMILASSMQAQFNPLSSFNNQATPVSIQVSERYQALLHEYCAQPIEDFLQSQIYLWIIIGLLVVFSISARRTRVGGFIANKDKKKKTLASSMSSSASLTPTGSSSGNMMTTSGQLLAHQHEANLLPDSHSFGPFAANVLTGAGNGNVVQRHRAIGNIFLVTLISAPIYFTSVVFHVHGHNLASSDLVSSVTMVLIAFTILIGTFLPVLRNVSRYDDSHLASLAAGHRHRPGAVSSPGVASAQPLATSGGGGGGGGRRSQQNRLSVSSLGKRLYGKHQSDAMSSSPSAFAMFPEFASTGLRRPSSIGGESGSHAGGSRRPFADTKESRRQMGVSLANLPVPNADSLRGLCIYNSSSNNNNNNNISGQDHNHNRFSHMSEGGVHSSAGAAALDAGLLNLKLNLGTDDEMACQAAENDLYQGSSRAGHPKQASRNHHKPSHHHHHHHHNHHQKSSIRLSSTASCTNSGSGGEKRLIMLDVDPSCPRHGMGSSTGLWSHRQSGSVGGGGGSNCMNEGFSGGTPN